MVQKLILKSYRNTQVPMLMYEKYGPVLQKRTQRSNSPSALKIWATLNFFMANCKKYVRNSKIGD